MSRTRFALDTRIATIGLVFVLALVSMPSIVVLVTSDAQCAITMDICHTAQSIDVSHAPLFASPPQLFTMAEFSRDAVRATRDGYCAMTGRLGEAPESPPPRVLSNSVLIDKSA